MCILLRFKTFCTNLLCQFCPSGFLDSVQHVLYLPVSHMTRIYYTWTVWLVNSKPTHNQLQQLKEVRPTGQVSLERWHYCSELHIWYYSMVQLNLCCLKRAKIWSPIAANSACNNVSQLHLIIYSISCLTIGGITVLQLLINHNSLWVSVLLLYYFNLCVEYCTFCVLFLLFWLVF